MLMTLYAALTTSLSVLKQIQVKVGTISAAKESEPEKLETRAKVEEDRKPQVRLAACHDPSPQLSAASEVCTVASAALLGIDSTDS